MQGLGLMATKATPHPLVRAFSMRREWRLADDPLHVLEESPDTCHASTQCTREAGEKLRRTVKQGTGCGVFFAREMVERSGGVPQGLICVAHGGTRMEQWDPALKKQGGASLYGSMLLSVRATGQPVAGMLWYQGESDTAPANLPHYTARMQKLVAATRRDLNHARLPWIIVQIGRAFREPGNPIFWNSIQEQQRLLPSKIKHLETVPSIDLPLDDFIHIGSEGLSQLGTRLASAADRMVYGNKHEVRTPQLHSITGLDLPPYGPVEVTFDCVRGDLQSPGEPSGFSLRTPEGQETNMLYKTELKGNKALLHMRSKLAGGFNLFYGHGTIPYCNIRDARGFSLPVFGPYAIGDTQPKALTPFVTQWNVARIVETTQRLDRVPLPNLAAIGSTVKSYPERGFIDEHELWAGKSGHGYFHATLNLNEPMKLEFRMGYDGPFRLWLDGRPFYVNMKGTNPCLPDEGIKAVALEAGGHDIHVGMDLNEGRAWGFFLRFARLDTTLEQIQSGNFVAPTYSV